jgi:hypothetical protein
MRRYVYDFPAGSVANFYIEGDNPSIGSAAIIGISTPRAATLPFR